LRIEPVLLAVLLGVAGGAMADARQDYILNCLGCHQMDGTGAPPAIPRLKDRVGYYLTIPQGRAYLAQVPGAANSLLDDARLASVLNWIVAEFAGVSRPAQWAPYGAAEVADYRASRPDDVDALRHALTTAILEAYPAAGAW
jgi:mono/diheme cytochrome c family protein